MNGEMAESQLRVFVSSTMSELRDAREIVGRALHDQQITPWIYESDAGARPGGVEQTCIEELAQVDVVVVLFHQRYGPVTITEFRKARELGKPLFVYIRDKDASRDKALVDFLNIEVLDLHRGVTYDYFDSAIQLSKQIGSDIQSWLVRRYREATAAIDLGYLSHIERERLSNLAERLQKATELGLTRGEPLDVLAQDVRAWLETLGYVFEPHSEYAPTHFEWVINVPRRRGYDRVLVRGTAGEVSLGDINNGFDRFQELNLDEAWLVSASRVSDAARRKLEEQSSQKVYCYTFDELLDEYADFSGYLVWLEQQVAERGIDRLYVPLAANKEEIDRETEVVLGTSRYDEDNGWLEGYIDRWLDDPSKEHISVLGEFGTGKTWFALHYAWGVARRYLDAKARGVKRPRLPLVIPLRDYAKAVSVESLFSEFFFRRHEIPLPGYSAFKQLNRMGKLLLIFDGFDEMAAKIDRQKMINNFWELARVIVPGSKAILTCRTEHFPHAQEGRDLLNAKLQASTASLTGKSPQFEVINLEKFDSKQIQRVLELRSSKETVNRVMRDPFLLDLARRPVMTEFILDSLPDIDEGKPVDISRVYLYSIHRKMARDITEERTFTSQADKLFFLCELSWEMLSTDQMSLNYRLFPDRLRRLFGEAVKSQLDLDHWHHDMMTQSLLIRDADGDYTPAHRSLLEFFAAYKIAAQLGMLAEDFLDVARSQTRINAGLSARDYRWSEYFCVYSEETDLRDSPPLRRFVQEPFHELVNTFGARPITRAVLDLIVPMIVQDEHYVSKMLLELVKQTREVGEESVAWLGSNAATLLARLNRNAFRKADLHSVSLPDADLSNVDMYCTCLAFADMRRCKLQNSDLTSCDAHNTDFSAAMFWGTTLQDTNMTGTDLNDAQFSEMGAVNTVAFDPDGNMLASGGADANVHVWDPRTGEEIFVLRGHRGEIAQVCWSTDGRHIASWSPEEDKIILWDVSSRSAIRQVWSGVPAVHSTALTLAFSGSPTFIMLKRYASRDAWVAPCEVGRDGLRYDYSQRYSLGIQDSEGLFVQGLGIRIDNRLIKCSFRAQEKQIATHEAEITTLQLHPGGRIGASSSLDATIRLWDLRPFISRTTIEALPVRNYRAGLTPASLRTALPDWFKALNPPTPSGMTPNPGFGECLLTVEQKLNCNGLQLDDAKGVSKKTLSWLVARGASTGASS